MNLRTSRLVLRSWTLDDVAAAFRMYGDAEVTRYLGKGATEPSMESQQEKLAMLIAKYASPEFAGYAYMAAELIDSGEVVGAGLLKPLLLSEGHPAEVHPEVEVGWHLARAYWGMGLATEIGRALMDYGFDELGLPTIYAIAYPENVRSIRVMEKLGMRSMGLTDRYYDISGVALYQKDA